MGNPLNLHFGLEGWVGPILYLVVIAAFLLSIFRNPAIGLYVIIPLLPMQTIRYRLHEYPLGHAVIDILLLGVTIGLIAHRERLTLRIPMATLMIVIAVYAYIGLWNGSMNLGLPLPLWFDDLRVADWKNNLVTPLALYVLVFATIKSPKQMKLLLLMICIGTFFFNRSIYSVVGQREYSSFSYDSRAETSGIAANGLAALESQFGFFLMGLYAYEKRALAKAGYLALALFSFYCVVYSFSRGGYIALLGGWLFLGVVKMRKLLPLLAVFLMVWQSVVPNAVRERVMMTYDANGELEDSANARVTVWEDAMEVFRVDPIFGMGYRTYSYMHRVAEYTDTHNLYVKVMVELGLVGLAMFLVLMWNMYRLGWTLFREASDPFLASIGLGFTLWMVCAFLTNLFGDRWNYVQINGYMWTFCAMASRALVLERESGASEAEAAPEAVAA